jgi:hypothetical protein
MIVPTAAMLLGRAELNLELSPEPSPESPCRSRREWSTRRSSRDPTVRGLSKSAMRSASMLDPPALMRMNSTEMPARPRIALTWAMARKDHEFTSTRTSVRSPGSSRGTLSTHSMQHPPRPKSRTLPRSRDPLKGKQLIWATPLQK